MVAMADELMVEVGYSDHTDGIEASIAAVALGARIIEKHLTLDRTMTGPDHSASAEPEMFLAMVDSLRRVEKALGSEIKSPGPTELPNREIVRKSIVAIQNIPRGEIFTTENLGVKRPGSGISPMRWHEVIGTVAHRDFHDDEQVDLA
jgi:N,N'-diacetyllegionaminate synthase